MHAQAPESVLEVLTVVEQETWHGMTAHPRKELACMPDPLFTLFISYSHADRAFVDRLEADLRKQGFDTWIDRQRLAGGQRWRRELQEAVECSQVMLVVLSPEAVASEYVQEEYGYASDEGKVVIPLYYRPCKVPLELRGFQRIDFQLSYEQGLAALVKALQLHEERGTAIRGATSVGTHASELRGSLLQPQAASRGQPEVEAEHHWSVPFRRNPFFTGRGPLLKRLRQHLRQTQQAALSQPLALSGLGGIGKTQTAIEYAYRYRDEYSAVFWVNAASRDTLVAHFVDLARMLDLSGRDAQDQMLIVAAVKRWLEQHEGWLLILDNADEVALLADFLPNECKGHILITTRSQSTGNIAFSLSIEKMEPYEGIQLLLRRAKLLVPDAPLDTVSVALYTQAQTLVEELDGLPLALEQAGAYIEETSCSLSEYLELYQRHRLALLKQHSLISANYPHTVASTWALSFRQVEQTNPAAAELLRLCAFLHPDAIPEAIIIGGAELGPLLKPMSTDTLLLHEAIQTLRRYSLIKRDPQGKLLNMHRLVQLVLRDGLDQETQRKWAERTVYAINRVFPRPEEVKAWPECQQYLPHTQICLDLIDQYEMTFPEATRLLNEVGEYLRQRGQFIEAELYLRRALAIREQTLESSHPEIATSLNSLARLFYAQGKYDQAEPLYQRALSIREQVYGSNHPDVAQSLNDLAVLYWDQSKYDQAEPLYQRALSIREQVLGTQHPHTAMNLNDLALVYESQGKYTEAEPFFQRALTLQEHALGPMHPDVATTLNNLAIHYDTQGKYEQAEPLFQRALAISEQVLGSEHPNTAAILDNLAILYYHEGKYSQAEPLTRRTLATRTQTLGLDHPDTANSLNNLAVLYSTQGKYAEAEPLMQQALTIRERALGLQHPRVANSLKNLAKLNQDQGKYTEAELLYQQALAIYEQIPGPDQPALLQVLESYTDLLRKMNREAEAVQLEERAKAIQAK